MSVFDSNSLAKYIPEGKNGVLTIYANTEGKIETSILIKRFNGIEIIGTLEADLKAKKVVGEINAIIPF